MNGTNYKRLLEEGLRRELTPAERGELEAYLQANSSLNQAWQEDQALMGALRALPDKPVSSNFTALVMAAVQRESAIPKPVPTPWWWRLSLRRLAPRLAMGAVLAGLGWLSYHQYQQYTRVEMARSVARVCGAAKVVGVDVLLNYDAINHLMHDPDEELYFALSK